jgi:hypothetical protein
MILDNRLKHHERDMARRHLLVIQVWWMALGDELPQAIIFLALRPTVCRIKIVCVPSLLPSRPRLIWMSSELMDMNHLMRISFISFLLSSG